MHIKKSFDNMKENILDEMREIETTARLFTEINENAENIATVAEEHAASTEELMATTVKYNDNIEHISVLMNQIRESSNNLEAIVQTTK